MSGQQTNNTGAATIPSASSFTPRAEMPMPGGTRQLQLWEALDDKTSLYELSLELARLGQRLHTDPDLQAGGVKIAATVHALWMDAGSNWEMFTLLHTMDTAVIRSIILGTVAHEAFHNRLPAYPHPSKTDKHAQGVYVIGLRRDDCNGEFLNDIELRKLIEGLNDYIQGCRVLWNIKDPVLQSSEQQRLAQWVARVDETYSGANRSTDAIALAHPTKAKYIADASKVLSIQTYISSLQKRLLPSGSSSSDAATRHVQSPLYVGCSANLTARLANYNRTQHFTSVNRPLALTASVLSALGYPVYLLIHVVLRTWKANQLPRAEQLVVTLANSLVHQTGFNSRPGGDNPGSNAGAEKAEAIVLGNPAGPLQENLRNSEIDRQNRVQFEADLDELNAELDYADTIKQDCDAMATALQPYLSIPANDLIERAEADLEFLRQELERLQRAQRIASATWAAYKAAAPEVCQRIEDDAEAASMNIENDVD